MVRRKRAEPSDPIARPVQPFGDETRLGTFTCGKLVTFTVYQAPGESGTPEYRVYATDGPAGPHLVCYFTPDRETPPVWRGAWNGDDWSVWIEKRARKVVANPEPATTS